MDAAQSIELIERAATHLRWARRRLASLRELALTVELDNHEKLFRRLLHHLQQACDALVDASVLIDGGALGQRISMDQDRDPLLHYFCRACNHPAPALLRTGLDLPDLGFQVIDPVRFRQVRSSYGFTDDYHVMLSIAFGTGAGVHRLQRKLLAGHQPDRFAIKLAGLKLVRSWRSVGLRPIEHEGGEGMPVMTAAPKSHFGMPLAPAADEAAEKVILHYESLLQKLQSCQPPAR